MFAKIKIWIRNLKRWIRNKEVLRATKYLSQYIGCNIVRTKPTKIVGDWSYTDGDPIKLLGLDKNGCIRYQHTGISARLLDAKEHLLSTDFTDTNWISFSEAITPSKNNLLNKWSGKKVKRICRTENGDGSFMCNHSFEKPVTLISASKHHVYIEYNDERFKEKRKLLNPRFAKPKDWVLAE